MHRSNKLAYFNIFQLILDIACLFLSFFLAYFVSSKMTILYATQYYLWIPIIFIPLWMSVMAMQGMYNASTFNYYDRIFKNIFMSSVYSSVIVATILFFIKEANISRILYLSFLILSFILVLLERYSYIFYIGKNRKIGAKNVLLIAEKEVFNKFEYYLNKTSITLNIVQKIIVTKDSSIKDNDILGDNKRFGQFLKDNVIDEVIFGLPIDKYSEIEHLNQICSEVGITTKMLLNFPYKEYCKVHISSLGTIPMVIIHSVSLNNLQNFIKRTMDVIGALSGIILSSPIWIVTSIAIKIETGGPVFFRQSRVGRNGRIFMMYKFRSMVVDAEEKKKEIIDGNEVAGGLMFKIKNDPRVTKVGKFIRKTSIDELPQFINVLKGEMSLVGTRPPTVDEVEQYDLHHYRRISIKPGITGMWQVSGRSNVKDFDNVVNLDTKYIEEWSILLDIKIIVKTVFIVFRKQGAY